MMDKLQSYTRRTMAEQRFALEVLNHPEYSKLIIPNVVQLNKELEKDIRDYAKEKSIDEDLLVTWIQIITDSLIYYVITKNEDNFVNKKAFIAKNLKEIIGTVNN